MGEVDTNKSGVVDFTGKLYFYLLQEFLMATMEKEKLLSKKKMEQTF